MAGRHWHGLSTRTLQKRTPLAWAAGYGYVDIVRMLINVEGVEIDSVALSQATVYGHTDVVRALKGLDK